MQQVDSPRARDAGQSPHQCMAAADELGGCCEWISKWSGAAGGANTNCFPPNEGEVLTCGDLSTCSPWIDGGCIIVRVANMDYSRSMMALTTSDCG